MEEIGKAGVVHSTALAVLQSLCYDYSYDNQVVKTEGFANAYNTLKIMRRLL